MQSKASQVHALVLAGADPKAAAAKTGIRVQSYYSYRSALKTGTKLKPGPKPAKPKPVYSEIQLPSLSSSSAGSIEIKGDPAAVAAFLTGLAKGMVSNA